MQIRQLEDAVAKAAAFRRRRRLQPTGGAGTVLFPPTYPGDKRGNEKVPPRHVFERRRIDGEERWCVLLDSVQSQANRLEEALLVAAEACQIALPRIEVDFAAAGLNSIGHITSLQAPHRVFDAILRDSQLEGLAFPKSPLGMRLVAASTKDATAILEASPTALLFGAWNSTGQGGGLGAKFARAIVSEIVGVDVPVEEARLGGDPRPAGRRTGSRIDPLGVVRSVEVYKGDAGWDVSEKAAGKAAKKVRPSEINHGNIAPSVEPLGVTCAYAEQVSVITLAGLRRLRFGDDGAKNVAGRCLIAALGLLALVEQDEQGYALRSRCDLVPDGPGPLELVRADGTVETVEIDVEAARALYASAFAMAQNAGFHLSGEPVRLMPQDKLVHIVKDSMQRALAGQGEPDADD